jgi:hypothetical protein
MLSRWIRTCALAAVGLVASLLSGCGRSPEDQLVGCWRETGWSYERADEDLRAGSFWNDGVRPRAYPTRSVMRHEGELWEFHPRGRMSIGTADGVEAEARWRLKGRGHVLAIRHSNAHFEVYDIKQISSDSLTLHFDAGMEVRGIARLDFARTSCGASPSSRDAVVDASSRAESQAEGGPT